MVGVGVGGDDAPTGVEAVIHRPNQIHDFRNRFFKTNVDQDPFRAPIDKVNIDTNAPAHLVVKFDNSWKEVVS